MTRPAYLTPYEYQTLANGVTANLQARLPLNSKIVVCVVPPDADSGYVGINVSVGLAARILRGTAEGIDGMIHQTN